MKTIKIKYLPPSYAKGSRFKATCGRLKSVTIGYPHEAQSTEVAARMCAEAFLDKNGMSEHKCNILMGTFENSAGQAEFYTATICPMISAAAELLALVCSVKTKKRVAQLSAHIDANINPYKRDEVLRVLGELADIGRNGSRTFGTETDNRLNALDAYLEAYGLDYTAPETL